MSPELIHCMVLAIGFLGIFFLGDAMYHYMHVQPENSRKTVHVLSGLLACAFPVYFNSITWVLALCISFVVLLLLSIKFGFLKGINAVDRKTYGSMVYPLGVFLGFVFYAFNSGTNYDQSGFYLFYIPLMILTLADPAAALIGKRWPLKKFSDKPGSKSFGGSGSFFITAFAVTIFLLPADLKIIGFALTVATVTTLAEAFSKKGLDNLFVPLGAIACLYLFLHG